LKKLLIPLILVVILGVEKSFSEEFQIDKFSSQSVSVFSVVDSSIGIIKDPKTGITIVDLGTFYGIGGNGTVPDEIKIFRDTHLWKTLYKETGIAPSTSHSEWQIPQTVFYNELPGKYTLSLITNNTETLSFEFMVKQIVETQENDEKGLISIKSPLKQITDGKSPRDVICKEDMHLVFKNTNNTPACVKSKTVDKLIQRGWAKLNP
jgi:hypothetical protein